MTSLYQLVYTSLRNPSCNEQEIEKILDACRKNNPSKNVTGILLHSENHFIQYLEGDKDIIKLYDLIKDDNRHRRPVLLSYGPLKERVFPSWHMGYKSLNKERINFLTAGDQREKEVFQSIIKGEQQSGSGAINLLVKFFHKG
ncbi:BLUF domain-containing protein [Nafulsella turpanensis]|uniref:BLUF domain-containing protein n=1 Tax=Nafulsella turpanensis TaxID=1265690 RepID=UPI000347AFE2|nr:BLUF domain-containing protein [Nafulsella turpanensis]